MISKESPPPVQVKQPEPESVERESVDDAIAVIGIAGRYPGADDVSQFWDNLESASCAIGPTA